MAAGNGFTVRGEHFTVSFVYPLVLAPAWWAGSMGTTYVLAKLLNALLMSLGAVLVYAWGRRFLSSRRALTAAALTLCLPLYALTGLLMTENAFFPAFLLALVCLALVLEEPTIARQAWLVGAVALACATRVQGLVLLPVAATAVGVHALLGARVRLRAYWPLGAAAAAAAGAYVTAKLASGRSVGELGVYEGVRRADYGVGEFLRWLLYNAADVVLVTGVVPACALAVLLVGAGRAGAAERAFLAVAAAGVGWSVVLAAFAARWEPLGSKERYAAHAFPLLLLALLLWIERGAPRPRRTAAVAALAAVALVALLPLGTLFAHPSLLGNALGLIPFRRAADALGGTAVVRVLTVGGAAAAALAFVALPRRFVSWLAAAVGVFLAVSYVSVFTTYRGESRASRARAGYGGDPSWIDAAARGDVTFVNTANFEPETREGRIVQSFGPVWAAEFWNRRLKRVVSLGTQEPSPLPQVGTTLDWATGRVVGVEAEYVLARRRFVLAGAPLASAGELELTRVGGAVHLVAATEGVTADGRMGALAAYSVWRGPRYVAVGVERPSGRVLVSAGPLEPLPGGGARVRRVVRSRSAPAGTSAVVSFRGLTPPFRVEVRIAGRNPTARVGFEQ